MSSSSAVPRLIDPRTLLELINELTPIINKEGLFYVFGSTAMRLRRNIALNPSSDIDCMLLLNGSNPLAFVIARILIFIHLFYLRIFNQIYDASRGLQIIQIDISADADMRKIDECNAIMDYLKPTGYYEITDPTKIKNSPGFRWIASTSLEFVPIQLKVIGEYDGRYLIKLTDTLNNELLDINVYSLDLRITERQAEYMRAFPASILNVGEYQIPTASIGMILCQQIDLFHSRYLARKRGATPREISVDRQREVRALWTSLTAEQQGALRGVFARPVNTYTNEFNGKEKTVIGEFLKQIGLEGGKRRRSGTKKRRFTRKTL